MNIEILYNEMRGEIFRIYEFWKKLRDEENGGFYGYVGHNLDIDKNAVKGVILNSRILWFFSNVYLTTHKAEARELAAHAFSFLRDFCLDKEQGGVYWSLEHDGTVHDSTKHTYNQAFAVYGLSSYYAASGDMRALTLAYDIFKTIEEKCIDSFGYGEAFDREWNVIFNDKLSEDGFKADKTMNTLLHITEAYTELYRVDRNERVKERLMSALRKIHDEVYDESTHILGVYFDKEMKSVGDVYSYGHDIEATWLIDRTLDEIGEFDYAEKLKSMNEKIIESVLASAYDNGVIFNQSIDKKVDKTRVWWIQCESVIGFLNAYMRSGKEKYLSAVYAIWEKIKDSFIDTREGGEWFYSLGENGLPDSSKPIVEPWKCPYHNGRMCMEVIKRYEQLR